MPVTTHSAIVKRPLRYRRPDGGMGNIPPGPCLVELSAAGLALVIWGDEGQFSAVMATDELAHAIVERDLQVSD